MPNRLIDSTSPYLLQHAHNPVEWHPWGLEALAQSRQQDKPIFLSIGYAACHWCHVMEHQCFENPDIAALMNNLFINIKVDREERPDLDDLYMLATQLMTGQGGWPMSVWLTPDLKPFYAGTYFPPADGYGRPGFPRLLEALADAWQNRRAELLAQADKVVEAIRMHADESAGGIASDVKDALALPRDAWIRLAIEQFSDRFDSVNGGLGSAPKFPPHQTLQLWAATLDGTHARVAGLSGADEQVIAGQLARTLDGMMNGGIYDQVGGGFARYSTDERWLVPHFEKMLYDSAQLAPVYARASLVLQNPDYTRIARHTLEFFLREMRADGGVFYSSLDADSEGEEGKFYVWTAQDVRQALPNEQDADIMVAHLGITPEGNWHESPVTGGSVLAIAASVESLSQKYEVSVAAMRSRIDTLLEKLRLVRAKRQPPGLDDKILTSWNGLMLSALAETGRLLQMPELLDAGATLADYLLAHHLAGGELQRVSRGGGPAHTAGFLDDHAFLLNGLIDLMEALPDRAPQWQPAATQLADTLLRDFQDHAHGGFFFTGPRHEKLFCRMKNAADNATPSANGVAIRALLRLSSVTGDTQYAQAARRAVGAFQTAIARRPEYFPTILLALLESDAPPTTAGDLSASTTPPELQHEPRLKLESSPVPPIPLGGTFDLIVRLVIPHGFHIQPATPGPHATTMRLRAFDSPILAAADWQFPPPIPVDGGLGYEGTLKLQARCTLAVTTGAGLYKLRASCTAQRCTAFACLTPETVHLDISITIR